MASITIRALLIFWGFTLLLALKAISQSEGHVLPPIGQLRWLNDQTLVTSASL